MKTILDNAPEAEQSVIGALLLDPSALDAVPEIDPEWFYLAQHREVVSCILAQAAAKKPFDPVSVLSALDAAKKTPEPVPRDLVFQLAKGLGTATGIAYYLGLVRNAWALRQARLITARFASDAHLTEAEPSIDRLQRSLSAIECGRTNTIVSIADAMRRMVLQLEAEQERKPGTALVSTGFKRLDAAVTGFEPGIFHLYAARPSVGKSALATAFSVNLGRMSEPAAVFWAEDTERMFALRVAAYEGDIPAQILRHGSRMEGRWWDRLGKAVEQVERWPLYIESTKGLSMPQVRQRMRRLKREKGVRVFMFDHLGKVRLDGAGERYDLALGDAASQFLDEAHDLGACPVAFHQLSKKAEEKGGTPSLGWLFNSDVLGQLARVVGFLARPKDDQRGFEVYLVKTTYGPKETTVSLAWEPNTMRVFEPVPVHQQEKGDAGE